MPINELVLLVAVFAVILYITSFIKSRVNPDVDEPLKTEEEYAQEEIENLIMPVKEDKQGETNENKEK